MLLMTGDTGLICLIESGTGNTVSIEAGTSIDTDFSVYSQTLRIDDCAVTSAGTNPG
ncbi:MAG: hypothetical protein HRT69_14815 [Flavobacteriaceae bacterium]|nr:hypothetical protein [Flavobacteriaceae bacterium]